MRSFVRAYIENLLGRSSRPEEASTASLQEPCGVSSRPLRQRVVSAVGDRLPALLAICLITADLVPSATLAAQQNFTLAGANFVLTDVTPDAEVFFQSMRLNRVQNAWNVEVRIRNRSGQPFTGPVVLLVESFSGTTGPLLADGLQGAPAKSFYDFSGVLSRGQLAPSETTENRTLSLAVKAGGSPRLVTKVFASRPSDAALAFVRSLNEVGQPLPGVTALSTGPAGAGTNQTDAAYGVASLAMVAGENIFQFSAPGFHPVWRKQTLDPAGVSIIPNPRLTKRDTNEVTFTPIAGGVITRRTGAIQISFGPGAFPANTRATLTPLTGQTLPAFLPLGWSPLQAFWLEAANDPVSSGAAILQPWGPLNDGEQVAFVQWNANALRWDVKQLLSGNGANPLSATITNSGAFALVVADFVPLAPASPRVGQPLPASSGLLPDFSRLTASGRVDPTSSPASKVPELVTGVAEVVVTNSTGNLPSGILLRGEVTETYRLRDGSRRVSPQYENFIVGYQRPGDANLATLQATFPMRPLVLFGAEELDEATVTMDVLAPTAFTGAVLDASGGQLVSGNLRILAGSGDLLGAQAAQLRLLDPTNFAALVPANMTLVSAFDLTISGVAPDHKLIVQSSAVPTTSVLVLAQVLSDRGVYGLQPVERLTSDNTGKLASTEPASGERLPGVTGAGQFLLLRVNLPQGLVTGTTRDAKGQAAAGLAVKLAPWLALSAADGRYRLLAPVGTNEVSVTDLGTGDTGSRAVAVLSTQNISVADLSTGSSAPRVLSVTPAANATGVSRVSPIVVTFSEPVNVGTPAGGSLRLVGSSDAVVAASLNLNLAGTVATLLPTDPLAPSTLFTIQLSTNITDLAGLKLEGPIQFTFKTESDTLNRVGGQLIIYEPTNGLAAVFGSPGTADPESPVILVNDTSGATAAIVSRPDGSFTNFITAGTDDFLSAVLVNANGTRTIIPASRQVFRDGRIGLFQGGGILEAQSEGGPVQISIEPGAIKTKNIFLIEPLGSGELLGILKNTPPNDAKLLGGLRVKIEGDLARGEANIALPVNLADLNLQPGETAEDGAYALAIARQNADGEIVYQVVDKLRYENGKIKSNTLPFLGFLAIGAAQEFVELILTAVFLGQKPVTIAGTVIECPANTEGDCLGSLLLPFSQSLLGAKPLPGAFVTLHLPTTTIGRPGRLRTGIVYATSGPDGKYALVLPSANRGYVLTATHPRFLETPSDPVLPLLEFGVLGKISKDFSFKKLASTVAPPRLTIAHSPLYPAPGSSARLEVNASHGAATPTVLLDVTAVKSLAEGVPTRLDDVQISNVVEVVVGHSKHVTAQIVSTNKALVATIRVRALVGLAEVSPAEEFHAIAFEGEQQPGAELLAPADKNDRVGPVVVGTVPPRGGVLLPGERLKIRFNEPIAASSINQPTAITFSDTTQAPPGRVLSSDQQTLELSFGRLQPNQEYTVKLTASIADLSTNSLDQEPGVPGSQDFSLTFRAPGLPVYSLPGIQQGGGIVLHRQFAYALERSDPASLVIYDLSNPANPVRAGEVSLPSFPRDLVLIPRWAYVPGPNRPARTNDLLAVVGGAVGSSSVDKEGNVFFQGQYLRVFDISNPTQPTKLVGALITLRPNAVTKVRWKPPQLAYFESGSDSQQIGVIDLQEFIYGFSATSAEAGAFPLFGVKGKDENGDGDYIDPLDQLPIPMREPPEFFGKKFAYTIERTRQRVLDFDFDLDYCGVVLSAGQDLDSQGEPFGPVKNPRYRTLAFNGNPVSEAPGSLLFQPDARPKRVATFFGMSIQVGTNIESRVISLVSLSPDHDGVNKLAVVDITLPESPSLLRLIPMPARPDVGALQSITQREDGMLALATTTDLVLLDPLRLALPNPPDKGLHPAIVSILFGAGSGNISLGSSETGLQAVNLGGRHEVIQVPPRLRFVSFPSNSVLNPLSSPLASQTDMDALFKSMREHATLAAARFRSEGGAISSLTSPSPLTHYYVLVDAPGGAGGAGGEIELGLESLNRSGFPLKNKGRSFPPVRALSANALQKIGQSVRLNCDAPIRALKAKRLSNDPKNPFYNQFLSRPFALVVEQMSASELQNLTQTPDREILWSGFFLRAFIDSEVVHAALSPFAATVDLERKTILPGASVVAETLPASYIMGPNPPPAGGHLEVPGTFGTISAHNGEFRHDTIDMALPGRGMPITFERTVGGQDVFEGAFGRGWDHNYNQQLTHLRPNLFLPGVKLPMVIRALLVDNTTAESGDTILQNGAGRNILFKNVGKFIPPEIQSDPLVQELGWTANTAAYFLPDKTETGIFDLLFQFHDGQFARLTPDGMQYWYSKQGRLEKIYHRYTKNSQQLAYNERGELVRISDKTIDNDKRFLGIGYFRLSNDPDLVSELDESTEKPFVVGKVARLKDYSGRDVLFKYSDDGILLERNGPEASGSNGGVAGRPKTVYLWSDTCSGNIQGIVAGATATGGGTPLFSASLNVDAATTGGQGAGGLVGFSPPGQNSAANVDGSATSATGPAGSTTEFSFDKFGYPKNIKFTGAAAADATHLPEYTAGLLTKMIYPEKNFALYTYDTNSGIFRSRGNLLKEERHPGPRGGDPAMLVAEYHYDARYNFPSGQQTDFNGNQSTYTLRSDGRDIEMIDHAGAGVDEFKHSNDYGQLERHKAPDGLITEVSYDESSGFTTGETRDTISIKMDYDSTRAGQLGVPTSVDLPEGDDITAIYDGRLLLTSLTRGLFQELRGYDENGNLISLKRTLGDGAFYEETRKYNQIGFLEEIKVKNADVEGSPAELLTKFEPDEAWRVKKVTYPGGEIRSFKYDHLGNAIKMEIGTYNEDYVRDLHGNLIELKQKKSTTRTIKYDGYDRPVEVKNKTGTGDETTVISHFGEGEQRSLTVNDPNDGLILEEVIEELDALGRQKKVRRKGSVIDAVTRYSYPAGQGGSVIMTGPRDTTTTTHDAAGRTRSRVNSATSATVTPDNNGNVRKFLSNEGANTYLTTFEYDRLDHRTKHSDDLGKLVEFQPRLDGLPVKAFDGLDRRTDQEFTVMGEAASIKKPNAVEITYHYDKNRQPSFVGDKTGKGHSMAYDPGEKTLRLTSKGLRQAGASVDYNDPNELNLPKTVLIPGGSMTLKYDLQGRITSQDVQYNSSEPVGNSYKTDFTPDALGRVRKAKYGSSEQYTATYGYDKLGPMISAFYTEALGSFTFSATLNADGSRNTCVYPSAKQIVENRQLSGRLDSISVEGGEVYKVDQYAGAEIPGTVLLGNGLIREINRYDLRKRVLSRRYERAADGVLLADVRYRYDAADNIVVRQEIHRQGRANIFRYDDGNRLLRADVGVRPVIANAVRVNSTGLNGGFGLAVGFYARTYTYDGNGLDLLMGHTNINPNALALPPPPPFAQSIADYDQGYLFAHTIDGFDRGVPDPLGNTARTILQVRPPGFSAPTPLQAQLAYNGLSQLVKVTRSDGLTINYEFRPDGLMHHRLVIQNGTTNSDTGFVYDQGRLIEEYERTGTNAALRALYYYAEEDSPFAADIRDTSGAFQRYYYLKDALGSVVAVADATGKAVERINYDPWGQPEIQGRDISPPQVSAVFATVNNELLVQFTELVMPPLANAGPGTELVTGTEPLDGGLNGGFQLGSVNGPVILGAITYEEDLPVGFPFGAILRLRPQGNFSTNLVLTIRAGTLIDEWGNPNQTLQIPITLGAANSVVSPPGLPIGSTGPQRIARSGIGNPFLFHGQYFDYDAGLVYLRARFYDPFTGLFLQRDPDEYEDSVNLYAAFGHNPVNLRDPTGRQWWTIFRRLIPGLGKGATEQGLEQGAKGVLRSGGREAAESLAQSSARGTPAAIARARNGATSALEHQAGSSSRSVVSTFAPQEGTETVFRGTYLKKKQLDQMLERLRRGEPIQAPSLHFGGREGLEQSKQAILKRSRAAGKFANMPEEQILVRGHVFAKEGEGVVVSTATKWEYAAGHAFSKKAGDVKAYLIKVRTKAGVGVRGHNEPEFEVGFLDQLEFSEVEVFEVLSKSFPKGAARSHVGATYELQLVEKIVPGLP